jgi:hypothetical protein
MFQQIDHIHSQQVFQLIYTLYVPYGDMTKFFHLLRFNYLRNTK